MTDMENTNEQIRILIVDDDAIVADSLAAFLSDEGYTAITASSGDEALNILNDPVGKSVNLVITDLMMPGMDGLSLLNEIRQKHPAVVVIVITGYGTIESAVQAVKQGAFEFLTKPIVDDEIRTTVEKALRQQILLAEVVNLKSQVERKCGLDAIIGSDHRMQKVYDLIEAVSESNTTILVSGESGTGKSMVAKAIHHRSPRHNGPFVTFACGSIPETLLESELFGHVKGAFTGAESDKPGKIKAAEGGTLFIDEINSATPALQLKLLRVLQEKIFEPVGSHQPVQADVRFVLATNANLGELVKRGEFREDLYYRINVVNIPMPPLRERTGDIKLLATHFLEKHSRSTNKVIRGFDDKALEALHRYRWQGNVRELENAMERAVVLTKNSTIELEDLPDNIQFQSADGQPGFRDRRRNPWLGADPTKPPRPLKDSIQEPEKQIILAALRFNEWNRQKTAEALDINRTTLYKKIKQYDLEKIGD